MKEFFKKIGRGIVKGAIYIYCKVVYRVKVVGKENIPKKGPIIICGNHRSFLDPPLIEVTCGRYTRFLAKEELTKNKFLAFLGVVFNAILVKRDSKEIALLQDDEFLFIIMMCIIWFNLLIFNVNYTILYTFIQQNFLQNRIFKPFLSVYLHTT